MRWILLVLFILDTSLPKTHAKPRIGIGLTVGHGRVYCMNNACRTAHGSG